MTWCETADLCLDLSSQPTQGLQERLVLGLDGGTPLDVLEGHVQLPQLLQCLAAPEQGLDVSCIDVNGCWRGQRNMRIWVTANQEPPVLVYVNVVLVEWYLWRHQWPHSRSFPMNQRRTTLYKSQRFWVVNDDSQWNDSGSWRCLCVVTRWVACLNVYAHSTSWGVYLFQVTGWSVSVDDSQHLLILARLDGFSVAVNGLVQLSRLEVLVTIIFQLDWVFHLSKQRLF